MAKGKLSTPFQNGCAPIPSLPNRQPSPVPGHSQNDTTMPLVTHVDYPIKEEALETPMGTGVYHIGKA